MAKNTQELLEKASELSKTHEEKKKLIESILNDLDNEKSVSDKHISGMATINEIIKEMNDIESEHEDIIAKIKNK